MKPRLGKDQNNSMIINFVNFISPYKAIPSKMKLYPVGHRPGKVFKVVLLRIIKVNEIPLNVLHDSESG